MIRSIGVKPEKPAPDKRKVTLEVIEGESENQYPDLPIGIRALQDVASAVVDRQIPFSINAMCGRGNPLSRGEFEPSGS